MYLEPEPLDVAVTLPEPQVMPVRRHEDGRLTADSWPEYMLIEDSVLADGFDPDHVFWVRSGILRVALANGEADYAVGERDARWLARPARRIRLEER